ncbi:MAG: PAAR domain-containing protein [Sphingobacteriales bacterium]|nr:PAAR domain-containing protein [Sphingobacteriales bacterium]
MKKCFFSALLLLSMAILCQSQNTYTGKFRVVGPNSDNVAVYSNSLTLNISPENEVSISLHFKGGSRTEPDDYIDLSGTITGTIEGGQLDVSGSVASEMKDAGKIKQSQQGMTILGSLNGNKMEGKVYMGPIKDGAFFDFTAVGGELKPALTFPAGPSPKVFNKGWVFGASFSVTDKDGNEVDLSDKVEWSGTATFKPEKGKLSRPVFNSVGSNKIILTVKYEGNTYKGEYPVTTVDVSKYAFQGCRVETKGDSHGCPACPHPAVGPITTGSPDILIYGHPAARVGDVGYHMVCCGPNTFTILSGDDEVLINGKAAALFEFSKTQHCGSIGNICKASGQRSLIRNKDVTVNNKEAGGEITLMKDDEIKTGEKGLLSFSNGSQGMVSLMPSTSIKVLENIPEQLKLQLYYGTLAANGDVNAGKKLLIELKKLAIRPKGTKFIVITDSLQSMVNVYHGSVTVTDKASGISNDVDSGFSYRYENGKMEILPLEENSAREIIKERIAAVDNTTIKTTFSANTETEETPESSTFNPGTFLRENILYIAGGIVVLVIIIVLFAKKKRSKA